MITCLRQNEIDKNKWDDCIRGATQPLIYGYSWYLDIVSGSVDPGQQGWDALVWNDYEAVMPLTWRKKYGIHYLCQPHFTQQLGVFSRNAADTSMMDSFLQAIPRKYRLIEINFNSTNPGPTAGFETRERLNHELSLVQEHRELFNNYSENTRRNVKKAEKNEIAVLKNKAGCEDIIGIFRDGKGREFPGLKEDYYSLLATLFNRCSEMNLGETWSAHAHDGTLLAGALIVISDNRAINMMSASTVAGRETGAMHCLFDRYIKEQSGNDIVLDFEGSDDPNLARFYKGFGAKECVYLHLRKNDLPGYIKWIKG